MDLATAPAVSLDPAAEARLALAFPVGARVHYIGHARVPNTGTVTGRAGVWVSVRFDGVCVPMVVPAPALTLL